jgi:hypothetical protein
MSDNKKQRVRSPMHEILNEIHAGTNTANGVLSRLWRIILKNKNIQGHQWEKLLQRWQEKSTLVFGDKIVSFKKNNLIKGLASDSMTWKTFMQGLQILNSTGRYKCIRFEVHFVHNSGTNKEVIGVNVIDRTYEVTDNHAHTVEYEKLVPGDVAIPGKHYIPEGFEEKKINGSILKCVSEFNIPQSASRFNGCSTVGTLLLEADGMESTDWMFIPRR